MTVLVVAALAGALAGCTPAMSEGRPADDGEPPVQPVTVTDLATFRLPLDPYQLHGPNLTKTTKAEQVLVERCVHRFGLTFRFTPAPKPMVIGAQRRYGLADEKSARARGYHLPPEPPRPKAQPPAAAVKTVLSGRGQSTIAGRPVPEGGCFGEARRRLTEGAPTLPNDNLAAGLSHEAFDRTGRDSRVRRVYAAWSACMQKAGHRYAEPFNANDDPEFSAAKPTPREVKVATADVQCKKQTDLINTLASVETAYQQRALAKYAGALASIKATIEQRERNAAAVLAE